MTALLLTVLITVLLLIELHLGIFAITLLNAYFYKLMCKLQLYNHIINNRLCGTQGVRWCMSR